MANVAQVLKSEIERISRKEIKAAVGEITRTTKTLRKTLADLKKRIANLEKEAKRFASTAKKSDGRPESPVPEESLKARLTAKGIRRLRKRLKLTRPAFAELIGTSPQSVYMWEIKKGSLNLRTKTKTALLALRGVGVREVKKRIEEVQGKAAKVAREGKKRGKH